MEKKRDYSFYILIAYAFVWIGLTIAKINYSVFWEDEAYTVWITKMSFVDMCKTTAGDVHPPLFYFITQIFTRIFGGSYIVYRIVPVVAYILLVCIGIFYIGNRYGAISGGLFITLLSLLDNADGMSIEVRMYEWVMIFVLCAYLLLLEVIDKNQNIYYIGFAFAILCAAYSHYYALITVAVLCAGLLVYAIIHRDYLKKTILALVAIVVIYLPWMIILLKTFRRTSGDYWITSIPSLWNCIRYVFKSNAYLEIILVLLTTGLIIYCFVRLRSGDLNNQFYWIGTGIAAVLITALVGIGVSKLFRPMFLVKYMYVCIVIGWMILLWSISKIKNSKWAALFIAIAVLAVQIPTYIENVGIRRENQARQDETMQAIGDSVNGNTLINVTSNKITYTILLYCFPDSLVDEVSTIEEIQWGAVDTGMVIVSEDALDEELLAIISEQYGCQLSKIVSDGYLGTCKVNLYQKTN